MADIDRAISNGCRMGQHVTCGVSGKAFHTFAAWACSCGCNTDGRYDAARERLTARLIAAGIVG